MNVLMITGDRNMLQEGTPAHERFLLQKSQVERLEVVYWGKGSLVAPFKAPGQFDVVTVQDPFWRGLVGWLVARRAKASFNVQVHTDLKAQGFVKRLLASFVLRQADSVRVVTEKIQNYVEMLGVKTRVSVLPVFVGTDTFSQVFKREHAGKNILWIGRFEEEKDPLFAIQILKTVLQKVPEATLIMLGSGSFNQKLSDAGANLPVMLPGWQNPHDFLGTADVVLSTSKHESYGVSIVEALAAGVPVVAPDIGVAAEAGAIVVPREKLAEEIIRVLRTGAEAVL